MNTYERIWEDSLAILKENHTPASFQTWFMSLRIFKIDSELNIVYLEVSPESKNASELVIDVIKKRHIPALESTFKQVLKDDFRVVVQENSYNEEQPLISENEDKKKPKKQHKKLDKENILNPKYTFENFVVGNSNKYAHAAALAVAESPSDVYNPLFIYGGSGLGKTHLIQAIGIHILENNPDMHILYTDSETFTNELIRALGEKKMNEFKSKYRKVDVLIIDDIQFIENKESTQEEFFHTFNTLYGENKQIIISSDRPPNKLVNLNERLRSRFNWNLIADIQAPDYETRVAILEKKAKNMNITIDSDLEDVMRIIAEKIKDNIREMEGAFNSTVSLSLLVGDKPDKAMAKRVLKNILVNSGELQVTPEKIKKTVCMYYNIKLSDLESSKKTNNIAYPRQIAMYLIREMTESSLPQIGKYFGGKHHTTVKYACEKIESDIKNQPGLIDIIDNLKSEIKE